MKLSLAVLLAALSVAACDDAQVAEARPPQEPTQNATGYYCKMTVVEHAGPKGHIFLNGEEEPLWFSSVRDTIAFTMLPEESKDIAAVYVNDMARAKNWDSPEAGTWMRAKDAVYVIGSNRRGGMGAPEAVPFGDAGRAGEFVGKYGGQVVSFSEIPRDFILSDPNEAPPQQSDMKHKDNAATMKHGHHGMEKSK